MNILLSALLITAGYFLCSIINNRFIKQIKAEYEIQLNKAYEAMYNMTNALKHNIKTGFDEIFKHNEKQFNDMLDILSKSLTTEYTQEPVETKRAVPSMRSALRPYVYDKYKSKDGLYEPQKPSRGDG